MPKWSRETTSMSDEQIKVFSETMANVPAALRRVAPELSASIAAQQDEVAETHRQAQCNGEILEQRIGSLAMGAL